MSAIVDVARLPLVSWRWLLLPWLIVALTFVVNYVPARLGTGFASGGVSILFVFAMVAAIQTISQWWPFAAALSVTRRRFFLADLLLALGLGAATTAAVLALTAVEELSGGWGASLSFFGVLALAVDGPLQHGLVVFSLFGAMWGAGLLLGGVYKRWAAIGVWLLIGLVVVGSVGPRRQPGGPCAAPRRDAVGRRVAVVRHP